MPYALLILVVGLAVAKVVLTDEDSYEGKFLLRVIEITFNYS